MPSRSKLEAASAGHNAEVAGPSAVPPWRALTDARATLTLAEGLGSRFHQAVSPRGAARSTRWRLAAAVCGALDVARARALRADDRLHLVPRLLADAADLALWCLAADDDHDSSEDAVIPGVALAAEAGGRLGPAGLVVPLVNALVAYGIRRARHHRPRLNQFSWQVMGMGGGWAVSLLARRQKRRLEAFVRLEATARRQQAELAGLGAFLAEHEGAIDLLQRATALVELGASKTVSGRRDLTATVKAAVAEATRGRSTYLRDALLQFQARRNLQPDLARRVTMVLEEVDGTVVLTAEQAEALSAALASLDLRGPVVVSVADRQGAREPFGRRDLLVDGHKVALPAPGGRRRVLDAVPAAFLLDLGWLAQPTAAHREQVAWRATLPPMALAAAAAAWSILVRERGVEPPPGATLAVAFAITALYTGLAPGAMANPHTPDGVSRFPWAMALQGYELVRGLLVERLGANARAVALGGTALLVALGWRRSPLPRSKRALVAELVWVVGFEAYARRLRRAMLEAGEAMAAEAERAERSARAVAWRAGRDRMERLLEVLVAQAVSDLEAAWDELVPDLREEAARRLERVGALLGRPVVIAPLALPPGPG